MQNVQILIKNVELSIQNDYLLLRDLSYSLAKLYLQEDNPIAAGGLLANIEKAKQECDSALANKEDSLKLNSDFEKIKLDDSLYKNKLANAKTRIKEINTILGALLLEYSNNNELDISDIKTKKHLALINKARSKKVSLANIVLNIKGEKNLYNYIGKVSSTYLPENNKTSVLIKERDTLVEEVKNLTNNLDENTSLLSAKKVDAKIVNKDKILNEYEETINNLKEAIISYGMYLIYNTTLWKPCDNTLDILNEILKVKEDINNKNNEITDLKAKSDIDDYLQLYEINNKRIETLNNDIVNIQKNIDELKSQNKSYQAKIKLLRGSNEH